MKNGEKIPKTIHYCWFGENPLGEKEKACIQSWKKYMPEYQIVQWDESNYDVNAIPYISQAYSAKQWAFVSDYARFDILYRYGGVYLDTDVELIKPIDDLVEIGSFMGCQVDGNNKPWTQVSGRDRVGDSGILVASGLGLASLPETDLYREILEDYKNSLFLKDDGSYDRTTVVYRVTDILKKRGLKNISGPQVVSDVTIYPKEYFNPKDFHTGVISVTGNTRSIHHFSMSWLSPTEVTEHKIIVHFASKGINSPLISKTATLLAILRHMDFERLSRAIKKRQSCISNKSHS